jgi:FAD/FMN-containing dehydrogenase
MHFVQDTHVPLVIENLQTEFCSSPVPNSLALWTRRINSVSYTPDFTPEQCSSVVPPTPAITFQVGATLDQIYALADKHDVTVVAATTPSLIGRDSKVLTDATSVLAPSLGSLMDSVLEFEVVTLDGTIRTVNPCMEKDLWFALRGGGTSSFGMSTFFLVCFD